jgi:hypothetical protein
MFKNSFFQKQIILFLSLLESRPVFGKIICNLWHDILPLKGQPDEKVFGLKVHKRENFLGSDLESCSFLKLVCREGFLLLPFNE